MTAGFLEIGHIMNKLLAINNINEAELGRKINIPRATINRLVNGKTPDPRASTLEAIAHYFNISVDQLLGKQPLFFNSIHNNIVSSGTSIPIINWEDSIRWQELSEIIKPDNHYSWIMIDLPNNSDLFALKVRGDSMWPNFQENTVLIINKNKEAINKNFVLAYIEKNKEVLFRQLIVEGQYRFLRAINTIFPNIQIEKGDKIIGVVIKTINNYD